MVIMSYHSDYDAHLDNYGDPDPSGVHDERDFEEEAYNRRLLDTGDGEGEGFGGQDITWEYDQPRHPDAYEYGEPWGPDNPDPDSPWGRAGTERRVAALAKTLSPEDRAASGLTQCQHGLYVCAECWDGV